MDIVCVVSVQRITQVHINVTERYARQRMMAASARHLRAEQQPRLASKLDCLHFHKVARMSLPFHARATTRNPGKAVKGSCSTAPRQQRDIPTPDTSR
jgi:hypothetical protein